MSDALTIFRRLDADRGPATAFTAGEAAVGVLLAGLALVAWASLTLAQLGELRRSSLVVVVVVAALILAVLLRRVGLPTVTVDRTELWLIGAVGIVAAIFFIPGAPYAIADKDPGVYATHAFAIARTGSTEIPDAVLANADTVPAVTPFGGRFPGYWVSPDGAPTSLPQFFHLFPSLLASAKLFGGTRAVFQLNPLIAILSTLAVTLGLRRAFGMVVASVGGVLLATNMLQVFFARYPSTEILAQALIGAALLAVLIAIRTRWAPAAAFAGTFATLSFLNRPDGVLILLLGVGALALIMALRVDRRFIIAGAIGIAVPLPSVWYQAFDRNAIYARANSVPSATVTAGLIIATLAAGLLMRRFGRPIVDGVADRLRGRHDLARLAGIGLTIAVAAWIAFGLLRERLLGAASQTRADGSTLSTLDEINLRRLFWFFSPAGLVLFWVGVAALVLVHRRVSAWVLLLPGLVLLPVYVWQARISPRLMWWGRRYIPVSVAVIVGLIAVGAVWLMLRRGRRQTLGRALGALGLLVVLTTQLVQSSPLVPHREFGGSWNFIQSIANFAGDEQAVFLWISPSRGLTDPARNASGPLWFIHDQISAVLPPSDPNQTQVEAFAAAFPGQEVFLLSPSTDLPPGIDAASFEPLGEISASLTVWAEGAERPDHAVDIFQSVFAWRLTEPSA